MSSNPIAGVTVIARRLNEKVGGRLYAPGDLVPTDGIPPRRIHQMIGGRHLSILTSENYLAAVRSRTDGVMVAAGFTRAGLITAGLATAEDLDGAAVKPRADPVKPAYADLTDHRGYKLHGVKKGIGTFYDVFTAQGDRVNAGGMLKGMKQVNAMLDTLNAAPIDEKPPVPPKKKAAAPKKAPPPRRPKKVAPAAAPAEKPPVPPAEKTPPVETGTKNDGDV